MNAPFWPRLDDNGLPGWIRADLRAMPDGWQGRSDYRTRRPVVAVRRIPSRSAERVGASHGCPPPVRGRTVAAVLAVVVVVLVVWRRP